MYMELKKLSIKNFIGDLPRIINDSFKMIEAAFDKIYHEDDNGNYIGGDNLSVKCKSISVTGNDANTGIVSLGDIKVVLNDQTISLIDLYNRILELEQELSKSTYSSSLLAKKKLQ